MPPRFDHGARSAVRGVREVRNDGTIEPVPKLQKLPGWAVENGESVRREASPYKGMSAEARAARLSAACRAAASLLAARDDAPRVLAHRDALPASSVLLLARLRQEARGRRGGG